MVVAVAVRVMKVAADAVVHVVAVRHRLVAAVGAVVARLMPAATMVGGAHLGVLA
jgi:hypothetical protein